MEIVQFFGRLHPLVLHLPIGFLALAFIMEWASRKEKFASLSPAVGFAIQLGMWSAIVAAGSGYLLSWEGGYEDTLLNRHKWLGLATVIVSIIVHFLYQKKNSKAGKKFYFPVFGGLMLLLSVTGHFGGSLTHGSDFLTAPFSGNIKNDKVEIADMDSAFVFQDLINPIFRKKCNSCHNESKLKGELLMSSIEGIQKGGKTGDFFKAGDIANSLFLQRVHLPLEEKEHMPPKGKKQLTKDEITLLEWWIKTGGPFNKKVGDVEQPENIKSILTKYATPDNSVFALKIPPAEESDLIKLHQSGISVELLSKEQPFVTVSLRGRQDIDKSVLRSLKSISQQLIELDLSNSNMNDDLLDYLANFPHLQKIFLQQTKVTGKNLAILQDLKYLEFLNLYDTPLEDQAVSPIAKLAGLKNVFLWKTNVSPKAIQQLTSERPMLHVNTGIDKDIFGGAELKPPNISVENDIFKDSLRVELNINFKAVNIYYTLDGTPPDSTSEKYLAPFLITQSADIQAIAHKEGWVTSPPSSKSVVLAKYQPVKVQLNKKPNDRYKAEGGISLGNFKKGSMEFTTGEWLGFEKESFTATLDMGKEIELSKVTVSALESSGSWIFFPKGVNVSISKNGKQYTSVGQKNIPTTPVPEPPSMKNFAVDFDLQTARYIKVEVKSNLVNPSWHPAPGEPCWVFVDEILVE